MIAAWKRKGGGKAMKSDSLPDPGSLPARARGCICSPERNNDGYGVETAKGRTFYPSKDCPLHGLVAIGKIWANQEQLN